MSVERSVIYAALFELTQSISGHSDLDSLCRALFRSLKRVVQFDFLGVMLHDASGDTLCIHSVVSMGVIKADDRPLVFAMDDNPAGWVWKHQQPLVIPRIDREARWPEIRDLLQERRISSLVLVPMTTG
jgi:transcriptional regulator with GAF, ATPase, and Fis domain